VLDISLQVGDLEMFQDEVKFRQVVGNLIKNALHHRQERVEIRLAQDGDNLVLSVSDDGPGIEPEHHDMVFRRYAQVKDSAMVSRKGHGLGLAGANIISRCLGGRLDLESAKGKGATFRLTIPLRLATD
jgi:signal transduction histidine kinase